MLTEACGAATKTVRPKQHRFFSDKSRVKRLPSTGGDRRMRQLIRKLWPGVAAHLAFVLMIDGFSASTAPQQVRAPEPPPPNVIVFLLDDATAADIAYMPKVQSRLASRGTTFEGSSQLRV